MCTCLDDAVAVDQESEQRVVAGADRGGETQVRTVVVATAESTVVTSAQTAVALITAAARERQETRQGTGRQSSPRVTGRPNLPIISITLLPVILLLECDTRR